MFLIHPRLANNNLNNDGLNDLLDDIDNTILSLAKRQYYNDIYGFTKSIDYDLYDTICEYKEILLDKLLGCNCLEDCGNETFLIYITSNIQKLTNSFC